MAQEFHVLRCFSCQSFQVQQVKKVNRWSCKLCGEKQSLLKEFGRGSGADCRRHVQKLNAMRGSMMEEQDHNTWSLWKQVEADGESEPEGQKDDQVTQTQVNQTQVSRWSKYLDTPEEAEPEKEEEESVLMDKQHVHGDNMIDRKRRGGWTDREQNSWSPGQSNWSSLVMKPVRPSATTRTTSLNHTCPPSLNSTRTTISPPSKKSIYPPSVRAGPLSSDCQVEEPSVSGWSHSVGGAASLTRPRPLLPVSSMFESGEEFSFDESELIIGKETST